MCNRKFLMLVALLVGVAYADVMLPTMPPLIQHFARIQSCKMTVYAEYPPTTVYTFDPKYGFKAKLIPRGGKETYCCEGWEDAEGEFDGTSVCSKQLANSTPYVTSEEYKGVLKKVADIRSFYERFKALETLLEKTKALASRVTVQQQKIYLLQHILST